MADHHSTYASDWGWHPESEDEVAGYGPHMAQLLARLPRDGQTDDMRRSIQSMLGDLAALEAEVAQLRAWKAEAMPVLDGLQELGRALGLPLGASITGPAAVERARALVAYAEEQRVAALRGPACVCLERGSRACGGGFCDPACEVCTGP